MVRKPLLVPMPLYETDSNNNPTKDARFLRDILRYFEIKGFEPFKFNELANYLMDHNADLRDEFASSPIPKSYRIHRKKSFIEARLKLLIDRHIIKRAGKAQTKNKQETELLKFDHEVIFHLMRITEDKSALQTIQETFMKDVRENMESNSSMNFYKLLLEPLKKNLNDHFLSFSHALQMSPSAYSLFFPWLDSGSADGFEQHYSLTRGVFTKDRKGKRLLLETLDSHDLKSKKLLYFQMKRDIEALYYWHENTEEFELESVRQAGNTSEIVFQTECKSCKSHTPQVIAIDILLQRHVGKLDDSHRFDCVICGKKGECILKKLGR